MESWFAPPERLAPDEIAGAIEFASRNAVVDALLKAAGGLIAILDEHRQILAVNDAFLESIGIRDAGAVLGLRPGEAIRCIHAHDMPGGCGTSRHCATCGAAIAIVATLADGEPAERRCVATVERDGKQVDLCLSVRAVRIEVDGRLLVLLFLQDIGSRQKQVAIERLFFHDVSNLVMGLQGTAHMLAWKSGGNDDGIGKKVARMADRLAHEIRIQRALLHEEAGDYPVEMEAVDLPSILSELSDLFASHPAAKDKRLTVECIPIVEPLLTDPHLLLRILANMLTNAFEGTEAGGEVRFRISFEEGEAVFTVWNRQPIPADIALRVFQRNFTTKENGGRGLGTYAMKRFGEQMLGGDVSFTSSESGGTTFRFRIPA